MAGGRLPHRLIALGLLWTFGVTLARGLRRPNDWAEAHWLISYDFGLLKRALPATLLHPVLTAVPSRAEGAITVVSTLLTAALCLALLGMCSTILRRSAYTPNAVVAVAAFLTSPFVVMAAHLNGYFDAQIILLSILATRLALRGRVWPAALLLTLGLLIHETIVAIGFPAVLWAALLQPAGHADAGPTAHKRLLPFLLPVVAFFALFFYQSFAVDAAQLERTLIAHLETFPFIEYDQEVIVPRSFAKSFVAHFIAQSPRVWGRLFDARLMTAMLPTVLTLLLLTHATLRASKARPAAVYTAVVLPFLPLSLHLIAWDTARIWTYPIVVALILLWAACCVAEPSRLRGLNSRALNALGILALPINVFGTIPLMDWRVERFSALWRALLYLPLPAALWVSFAQRRAADYTRQDN